MQKVKQRPRKETKPIDKDQPVQFLPTGIMRNIKERYERRKSPKSKSPED